MDLSSIVIGLITARNDTQRLAIPPELYFEKWWAARVQTVIMIKVLINLGGSTANPALWMDFLGKVSTKTENKYLFLEVSAFL